METDRPPSSPILHVRSSPTPSLRSDQRKLSDTVQRTPATPKKTVKLQADPSSSHDMDLNSTGYDSSSPGNSPARRRGEMKCNPLCPGHRKHSLCERRDKDSPRPQRHECDGREGTHVSRTKHRDQRKASQSPSGKINFRELHGIVDAVTEGGLGTRQYHSASHLAVLKNKDLEPSPGMKQRDFSMSYITDRPLTEKELRLMPLRPRSNSNSRSGSPLRTIKHNVKIERWDNVCDGELSAETMMKKFDVTGFSHSLVEIKAGDVMICEICTEVKKMGLVSGKVWVKMYGRRINLLLGDIIEVPANQAHKACADELEDAVLVMGYREGCCIT